MVIITSNNIIINIIIVLTLFELYCGSSTSALLFEKILLILSFLY